MAHNKEPKSFEQRTESFMNTMVNLTCGSWLVMMLLLLVLLVVAVIWASIAGD